ncbi:MAG: beta-ketoacyl-[acyl-carrier-protein] synthase family protein [Candidatus Firestonebacteria bacterium]|nr:beta-ketoacyl-[acyl-carrier-protein] synthase family protein [Candidatus Firestonebacteria bacterium]
MYKKRIVITGLGVIAPNGIGKEEFWQGLKDGRSGIKPVKRFDTTNFKCKLGGEADNFNPEDFLNSKGLKDLDRTARLLCSGAKLALDDAKLSINDKNTDDIGVCTGTTLSNLWNFSEFQKGSIQDGPLFTNASLFPGTVINAASSQVSIRFNVQGFNTTISTGYSSSIDALKYAIDFIRLGRVKAVLIGGVESFSLANFVGFYRLGFLSGIKGDEISCPFDKRRNGIILSEGAGVLAIEDEEYALARKADIYAEIKDIGNCFASHKIGKYDPHVKGLKESIRIAIKNSELRNTEIDYISASANSVPMQDKLETKAIKDVFGKYAYNIPVSSIKSMIGETFSAAGLFQIAAAIGSMVKGFIPPTINYEVNDKDCDLDYVANKSRITRINNVLINNFGPGGSNAALIISKYR